MSVDMKVAKLKPKQGKQGKIAQNDIDRIPQFQCMRKNCL